MVAAFPVGISSMLPQPIPKCSSRVLRKRVCTNPDDTQTNATVISTLAILEKEIHASFGPRHSPSALGKTPKTAILSLQLLQQFVEPTQIIFA
jgi:hypothetical protein